MNYATAIMHCAYMLEGIEALEPPYSLREAVIVATLLDRGGVAWGDTPAQAPTPTQVPEMAGEPTQDEMNAFAAAAQREGATARPDPGYYPTSPEEWDARTARMNVGQERDDA